MVGEEIKQAVQGVVCAGIIKQRDDQKAERDAIEAKQSQRISDLIIKNMTLEREKNSIMEASKGQEEALQKISMLEQARADIEKKYADLLSQMMSAEPTGLDAYDFAFRKLSPTVQQKLMAYEAKYAKVLVTFPARFIGIDPNKNGLDLDVKIFAGEGVNDWGITSWLGEQNCRVQDVAKDYPSKTFEECAEIAAVRIQARDENPYSTDFQRWGRSEFFEFPSETFAGIHQQNLGFDCDSEAFKRHAQRRAAGIPEMMMRVVVGETFDGQGHATNYMFFPSIGKFVHLNSTSRCKNNDDIHQFQTTSSADLKNDPLAIEKPWWSTTSAFSHMQMVTGAQVSSFRKARRSKQAQHRLVRKATFRSIATGEKIV